MKSFLQTFGTTLFLLLATATIAHANEVCLPTSYVVNTKFIKANPATEENERGVWVLYSDVINYKNQQWNIVLGIELENAHNATDALSEGQRLFQTIPLKEPQHTQFHDRLICVYAGSPAAKYIVLANNPPDIRP